MSGLRFAEPQLVHLVWALLAFLVLLVWLERRGSGALDRLVGSALRDRLVRRPSSARRRLRLALLGLAGLCLILALMRPQWGTRYVPAQRAGAEIMICLDVSRSMLAEDVAPNRLERAKSEIADLLPYLSGDQVGLIAFAGRASVLSPLTPDQSFLRLVLDNVGPHSVPRGGTRLEEPIRKAVAGFGPPGEAQRAILLITDGEDHDSFARDAAEAAAEQGIRIIAIGFGDEAGSEIYATDPETGARTLVRDGEGRPVRSRLDGELLRDLARITGGAYVPAGTGVLDLESIYAEHVAKLTRGRLDPRGRTVRGEAYQWPALAGLVLLIASVAVTARSSPAVAAAALALLLFEPGAAMAQADVPTGAPSESGPEAPVPDASVPDPPAAEPAARPETPREVYNRGVRSLESGALDEAQRLFARARREARGDGELRFAATYDLGMAAVRHADGREAEAPSEALAALHESADWFREAVSLRPEEPDARHNLEVVLGRALLLADRIARAQEKDLAGELAELADRERAILASVAALVEAVPEDSDPHAADALRPEFRARATAQRALLADADALAQRTGEEWDALQSRTDEELTPEDRMRVVQLARVLEHLHQAREHMGQARRQLRRRQAARGFRRASAALEDLKRAQDTLRDPVAVLDALLRDASQLATETAVLAAGRLPGAVEAPAPPPRWLTAESLADRQRVTTERTVELRERLAAGVAAPAEQVPPEAAAVVAAAREALPFVAEGAAGLERAADALAAGRVEDAGEGQREAILALGEARERFLDLRGLVEATHAAEQLIAAVLAATGEVPADADAGSEIAAGLLEAQERNRERGERLEQKILEAQTAAARAPAEGTPPPDAEQRAAEQERLELAAGLATLALARMDDAVGALERGAAGLAEARPAADGALEQLATLRRLFFSIVEQVRDLAERQQELGDETQAAVAPADETPEGPAARLAPRQAELGTRADGLAMALAEQSEAVAGSEQADSAEDLRRAGEHVMQAHFEMQSAAERLGAEAPALGQAREHQDGALAELALALALLSPPEQQDQQPPQQQQDQQQGEQDAGNRAQQQAGAEGARDPAQLLREVRDREAQRRREQAGRQRAGYETVERDW